MDSYFPSPDECPRRTIFPGVAVSTWWTDNLMLSYATLEANAVVPTHQHPHEQIGMVLEGRATFIIDGVEKNLGPGDRFRIPGNVPHQVIVHGALCRILDAFAPAREEYKDANRSAK